MLEFDFLFFQLVTKISGVSPHYQARLGTLYGVTIIILMYLLIYAMLLSYIKLKPNKMLIIKPVNQNLITIMHF